MFFRALRSDRGSAMVIYVVMFVALLGFAAVAVDTGRVIVEKQKLQDAVDAAALAAAQKLPSEADATSAANRYVTLNGFSPSDITVTFADSDKTIIVSARKKIDYTFGNILGLGSTTVGQVSKATYTPIKSAFDYALFSGSKTNTLSINGSKYMITGNTHTNSSFTANGSTITITGACEAASTITIKGGTINVTTRVPNAPYVDMPDFSDTIKQQAMNAGHCYSSDVTFNSSYIDVGGSIYVNGNVTINGSKFKGVGCILATGSVTFNGSSQTVYTGDAVCIYSKTGDININGSSATVDGILYAPKGCVRMNGSYQTVNGRVIGNTVNINGSSITITITGDVEDLTSLPADVVKLTK